MSTLITVAGHADERVAPELAVVSIAVAASADNAETAMRAASAAHERILADVRRVESDGALERWSAGQVRTWSHRPWNAEGRQLPPVFDARTQVEVVFRELDRVAEWVGALGSDDIVTVEGVDWRVTDATSRRVRERAQRRAVEDAVEKAAAYADALGLGTPVAVELADSGLLAPGGGAPGRPQPLFARAVAMGGGAPAPELAPAELVVEASVEARFSSEPARRHEPA